MRLSQVLDQFQLATAAPLTEDFEIRGVRPLALAKVGELSFLSNAKYRAQALDSEASALLLAEPLPDCRAIQILCSNPYAVLAKILGLLYPEPQPAPGIHPSAVIDASAEIAPSASIGPACVVGAGAQIGADSVLVSSVNLGPGARVGARCKLFPGVVLYAGVQLGNEVRVHANSVIGSDGFGYAQEGGRHLKVPQIGSVVIGDGVEIGAGTCIDRGALDDTVIGAGTIIDNQVQIAHGVKIGKAAIIISQTGISGSSEVGDGSVLAGKVGVVGHVKIGAGVVVMGDSVVTKNLDAKGRYAGNPAIPHIQYQRQLAHVRMLPELKKQVADLKARLGELQATIGKDE